MGSFRELFSVKEVLNSKGFKVISEGNGSNLLIPININSRLSADRDILFRAFDEKDSRFELLEKIKNPSFTSRRKESLALINHPNFIPERLRYSTTFEWYAGELMERKFSSFSSSYSVEIKDVFRNGITETTGDYDTIVVLRDTNIIYFECKTGSFNKDKIIKCIDRAIALHCEFSVLLIHGGINIQSLKGCVKDVSHLFISERDLYEIRINGNPASSVIGWNTCFFVNAEVNIEEQLRTIMRLNAGKKISHASSWGMSIEEYEKLGYSKVMIK